MDSLDHRYFLNDSPERVLGIIEGLLEESTFNVLHAHPLHLFLDVIDVFHDARAHVLNSG